MCNQNRSRITRDTGFVTVSMRNTSSVTVLLLSLDYVPVTAGGVSQLFLSVPHTSVSVPHTGREMGTHERVQPTKVPVMSAPTSAVGGDKQSRNLIPPNPIDQMWWWGREETNLQVVFLGGPWERSGPGRMWRDTFGKLLTRP